MMRHWLVGLLQDIEGKSPVRMALSATLIALSLAMTSPAFRANPVVGRVMGVAGGDMEKVLPESLEKVTEALRGVGGS